MLKVQEYLKTRSLEHLKNELGIKIKEHDVLPLVILNYDQLNSSKLNPISMECRGLILEKDSWRVVAKGFTRFFNFGEALEITNNFDWSNPVECHAKEDGSYINVFWYGDPTAPRAQWRMSTRGSFGTDELLGTNGDRWLDLVHGLLPNNFINEARKDVNYVFELTSPFNKVVRHYPQPQLVLLSAFNTIDGEYEAEMTSEFCDLEAIRWGFRRPESYKVLHYKQVESLLKLKESSDPTFEGFVLQDINGLRIKCKTTTYMALHRLRGEGDNMYSPKNLVPLILANEGDEILTYFPEIKETWDRMSKEIEAAYTKLVDVWWQSQDYEEQKAFAIYITKRNPTPFSAILFRMKQDGLLHDEDALKAAWRHSPEAILKHVFAK